MNFKLPEQGHGWSWLKWAVVALVIGVVALVGYTIYKLLHNVDTATSAIQKGAVGETIGRNIGNTVIGFFGSLWGGIKSWWQGSGNTGKQLPAASDSGTVVASV
jgi:hypothetical protein